MIMMMVPPFKQLIAKYDPEVKKKDAAYIDNSRTSSDELQNILSNGGAEPAGSGKIKCAVCSAFDVKLNVCSGCKTVSYCGKACQKVAWKSHKNVCKMRNQVVKILTAQYQEQELHGTPEHAERNARKAVEGKRDDEIEGFLAQATGTNSMQTGREVIERTIQERVGGFCAAARSLREANSGVFHDGAWREADLNPDRSNGAPEEEGYPCPWTAEVKTDMARQNKRRVLILCVVGDQEGEYVDAETTPIKVSQLIDASDLKFQLSKMQDVDFKQMLKRLHSIDPAKEFVLKLHCAKSEQHCMIVLNWEGGMASRDGR
jgi:hypothetical protein